MKDSLRVGGNYNFKNQPERLVYLGRSGFFHQFALVHDVRGNVWCELKDEDLHLIEETKYSNICTDPDMNQAVQGD